MADSALVFPSKVEAPRDQTSHETHEHDPQPTDDRTERLNFMIVGRHRVAAARRRLLGWMHDLLNVPRNPLRGQVRFLKALHAEVGPSGQGETNPKCAGTTLPV